MRFLALLLTGCSLSAEIHNLTLRQSLDRAVKLNPEIVMARFDELKASETVREVRDPFTPKLVVGSGLAYSSGFPQSIENSAPSLIKAQAIQTLYDRPLSFQVAAARENARGAGIDLAAHRDVIAHRVANLHLSAARSARLAELVKQQVDSFIKIADTVRARADEGRELPVEARAADLRVLQARQRLRALDIERDQNEAALAIALAFPPEDRVQPVTEESASVAMPASETEAAEEALTNSKQLRRLESAMQARQLQATAGRAARFPKVELVAQYALLAKFNNYEDFFRKFQRNNGQLGMSFQLPLFAGASAKSQSLQADLDVSRIRVEINAARDRISVDARKSFQDLQLAQSSRDVAKADLDITRERLGVALAQFEEGRTPLRQVEELRSAESEKWLAFYEAQTAVERGRIEVLRQTGTIMAMLD